MVTTLKRLFWLALLGGAGFAVWSMLQRKHGGSAAAPEWPPLDTTGAAATDGGAAGPASAGSAASTGSPPASSATPTGSTAAAFANVGDASPSSSTGAGDAAPAAGTADARSGARWVEPTDGACPISHPIKANDNSGIYHVPDGRFYERTGAERCYARTEDAEADGYRAAKS